GLDRLAVLPMDVVLMDLQFTQAIVDISKNNPPEQPGAPPLADDIELRIARAAARAGVNVFRRWALMQRWHAVDGVSIPDMGDESQLHTSEWATKWVSIALDRAIGAAVGAVRGARRQAYDI